MSSPDQTQTTTPPPTYFRPPEVRLQAKATADASEQRVARKQSRAEFREKGKNNFFAVLPTYLDGSFRLLLPAAVSVFKVFGLLAKQIGAKRREEDVIKAEADADAARMKKADADLESILGPQTQWNKDRTGSKTAAKVSYRESIGIAFGALYFVGKAHEEKLEAHELIATTNDAIVEFEAMAAFVGANVKDILGFDPGEEFQPIVGVGPQGLNPVGVAAFEHFVNGIVIVKGFDGQPKLKMRETDTSAMMALGVVSRVSGLALPDKKFFLNPHHYEVALEARNTEIDSDVDIEIGVAAYQAKVEFDHQTAENVAFGASYETSGPTQAEFTLGH